MSHTCGFFRTHRRTILALLFGLAFSATLAYAVPPGTQYSPGTTLDPGCVPGDTNCSVDISTTTLWGSVTGTLSDQTDLQSALNAKFNTPSGTTAEYVRGDGSITTFPTIPAASPITIVNSTSLFSTGLSGTGTGSTATNSIFLGTNAGNSANNASYSNFFGLDAGNSATNASSSNFFGPSAGYAATNAANSIFIGRQSGINDTVNNTAAYNDSTTFANTSILIGHRTSTGGYSNSIAIGAYATNTAANQLVAGSTNRRISSVFIGGNQGTASTNNSVFIGDSAGANAISANRSNFFGPNAGSGAVYAENSNFFGSNAGINVATDAIAFDVSNEGDSFSSNFFGSNAGNGAAYAAGSNFFGNAAGQDATNATGSNFLGFMAGQYATNASNSNFFGGNAGNLATNAYFSNFLGLYAGWRATNAFYSNFFGILAGSNATNAANSIFIGKSAGDSDSVNNTGNANDFSILLGNNTSTGGFSNSIAIGAYATNTATNQFMIGSTTRPINEVVINGTDAYLNFGATAGNTGYGFRDNTGTMEYKNNGGSWIAIASPISIQNGSSLFSTGLTGTGSGSNATNSVFLGANAGNAATNAFASNFFGDSAGQSATNASYSNFFGQLAGYQTTNANNSNFFGYSAGRNATSASFSNFFGTSAGYFATSASYSNFSGYYAGRNATSASFSNFSGYYAGYAATNASGSNFFGGNAGNSATNASSSNFFGNTAGLSATNASGSNFFGGNAGNSATNAANSIFFGSAAGFNDTVNNTAAYNDSTTFANTSILLGHRTSTGGYSNSIALGAYATNTATNQFMIGSTNRPIDTTRWNGSSSTQCTITTGTGIACTSDERLKTDVTDLPSSTLDTLLNVKTVTYHWLQNPNSPQQIGFLAQDLQLYFPQLVTTDSDGYKSVYYAQMTPILVEAIREMNLKITKIDDLGIENSWRTALTNWFGSASNGIGEFFANTTHQHTLCVGENGDETCITKVQLDALLSAQQPFAPVTQTPQVPTASEQTPQKPSPEEPASTPVVSETQTDTLSPQITHSEHQATSEISTLAQ